MANPETSIGSEPVRIETTADLKNALSLSPEVEIPKVERAFIMTRAEIAKLREGAGNIPSPEQMERIRKFIQEKSEAQVRTGVEAKKLQNTLNVHAPAAAAVWGVAAAAGVAGAIKEFGVEKEVAGMAKEMIGDEVEDDGIWGKLMKKFVYPLLQRLFGIDLSDKAEEAKEGGKGIVATAEDTLHNRAEVAKEKELGNSYRKNRSTLVDYMEWVKREDRDMIRSILGDAWFCKKLTIAQLEAFARAQDYQGLVKLIGKQDMTPGHAKAILETFFPQSGMPPVGKNYGGYLFQSALAKNPDKNRSFYDVVAGMGGFIAVGAELGDRLAKQAKNLDLSTENIRATFDDIFFREDDENGGLMQHLGDRARNLGMDTKITKELRQNHDLKLDASEQVGISEDSKKFIVDKLVPFVDGLNLDVFHTLHPEIDPNDLKTLLKKKSSASDVAQLYLLLGGRKFEDLSEDEQGIAYMKLWVASGDDVDMQTKIGKIFTSKDDLSTYAQKFIGAEGKIPERLRRFMYANIDRAQRSFTEQMSVNFQRAWGTFDESTKWKFMAVAGVSLFLYARFRWIVPALSFAVIAGALSVVLTKNEMQQVEPHMDELKAKFNEFTGQTQS